MCGFLTIYRNGANPPLNEELLRNATSLMAHRGPDDSGFHLADSIAMGHRRLSIIDVSSAGHQPMYNESKSIVVVFNGEIFNYTEIMEKLVSKGHRFSSKSDTEVLVHAYEEWGTQAIHRFQGMFAFTLWDTEKRLLWAARDRMGVKPFYYSWDNVTFAAASEIKPLLMAGSRKAELNLGVLDAYFSLGYVPGPETMFQGIWKLAPGHEILLQDGNTFSEREYWDFSGIKQKNIRDSEACLEAESLLFDSVRQSLVSDVPVGVFLSGGLDSSSVVALMKGLHVSPIDTFTVGYENAGQDDEQTYARIIAYKYQTRHHELVLQPEDFYAAIKTLVNQAEEPIVEAPGIALHHLSLLARSSVKVLLSGEGSDELFAGYGLYNRMLRIARLHVVLPPGLLRSLTRPWRGRGGLKQQKHLDWLSHPLEAIYQGTSGYLTDSIRKSLYSRDFFHNKGDYLARTFIRQFDKIGNHSSPLSKMLYVDSKTWLPDNLLLKADKMTMAASVELRVPFLDHRLVEFATALPDECKIRGNKQKWILKQIMRNHLPKEIIDRKKMGFPVPIKHWFRTDLVHTMRQVLSDESRFPWINPKIINRLLTEHAATTQDHSRILLSLLVLSAWQEEYTGR